MVSVMVLEQPMSEEDRRLVAQHKEAVVRASEDAGERWRRTVDAAHEPRLWFYRHNEHRTRFFIDILGAFLRS